MTIALEAGADDFKAEDDSFEITADPGDFETIAKVLEDNKIETVEAEVTMVPDTTVNLEGKDAEKMILLIDALDEHDDVQNVYANYEIDEEE
jgi:transcriptional/translational regulatory protein YebC/TACO1